MKEAIDPTRGQPGVDAEARQDQQVRMGIEAAKQGRFATPEQVRRVFRKYVVDG